MDTRWIQDFVTLSEVRNFTRAAELRNLSQAAFSRRIQALEQWLGTSLVDRAVFPLRITEAGERFRAAAVGLLGQIAEVKAEIGDEPSRNHVRISMPYALANSRLRSWWPRWAGDEALTCSVEVGNVHDTVSALSAGTVDLLICYHQPAHPVQLDAARFERHEVDTELVRPYACETLPSPALWSFPGTAAQPVPLLMYSPTVYFARVVDSAIERAPCKLHGYRAFEVAMSDVLADLAEQGLGVAWLPRSSVERSRRRGLVPVGDGAWDVEVKIVAYRSRANPRRAADRLWRRIVQA